MDWIVRFVLFVVVEISGGSRNSSTPWIYAHTYRRNPSSEIHGEPPESNDVMATFELRSSTYGSYSSNQPRHIYNSTFDNGILIANREMTLTRHLVVQGIDLCACIHSTGCFLRFDEFLWLKEFFLLFKWN